jgi:hypothetical protein
MYVRTAALIAIALGSSPAGLAAFTPEDYLAWLADNQVAEPQFVDGDTITYERADLVRPFIPAEYQNELIFPGMDMRIRDAGDLSPAASYIDATQRHEGTTSIDADGAIRGYVAGRPFDPETLRAGRKEDGYKLAWNWNYRWFGGALKINEVHWVWVRRGGSHGAHESISGDYRQYYLGGGTFERVLTGPYLRVYFSHRADLPDSDYRVPGAFASNTEFREYTGFTSPFDISGTAFLILRYDDPRKADDSWAYIPSLRRVRRISVEVKSDSLLGTDHTLEDFACFSGRILEQDWEYVGTARILAVARSRNTDTVYYGPDGLAPLDDWALRQVDVLRMNTKRENHPYSTKFLHIDRQSGECYYANAFDRGGNLWKVWQLSKSFTEDAEFTAARTGRFKAGPTRAGLRVSSFQSISVIDMQNERATLAPCRGLSHPDTDLAQVKRALDLNYLSEGR